MLSVVIGDILFLGDFMNGIIGFKLKSFGKDNLYNLKHSHDGYEILFVHSGSGNIIIKDKLLNLVPGAIYFINGNETHCTVPDNPESYCRSLLIMPSPLIDEICHITDSASLLNTFFKENGGTSVIPQNEHLKELDLIFEKMSSVLCENTEYKNSFFIASFLNILHLCIEDAGFRLTRENGIVKDVLNYINEHLCENILLGDICAACHVSRFYLCHTFKKSLGMTISEYILSRRLSEAKHLLQSSNLSVSEIAENCGFSSPSYFSMVFKRELGVTPSSFRQK